MNDFRTLQPCKSLVQEKANEWAARLGKLGLTVREVTGDTEMTPNESLDDADVICTTPEKLGKLQEVHSKVTSSDATSHITRHGQLADAITRKRHDQGGMRFFAEVSAEAPCHAVSSLLILL